MSLLSLDFLLPLPGIVAFALAWPSVYFSDVP